MKNVWKRIAAAALIVVTAALGACTSSIVVRTGTAPESTTPEPVEYRLELNAVQKTLEPGASFALIATVFPATPSAVTFTYESSDPSVATVNDFGVVTARSNGVCDVTVKAREYASAVCKVTVGGDLPPVTPTVTPSDPPSSGQTPVPTPPVTPSDSGSGDEERIPIESLEIVGPTDVMVGKTYQYTVKVTPENANEPYTLHNSMEGRYCTMTEDGLLTAIGAGSTMLTVETEDLRVSDSLKVYISVAGIKITAEKETIEVGESTVLHAEILDNAPTKGVWWTFSAPISTGSVTVVEDGFDCYVTGVKAGTVKITCGTRDANSINKTFTMKVVPSTKPVITLTPEEATLKVGQTLTLTAKKANVSGTLVYESSDEQTATVSSSGVVTAVSPGTAVITVQNKDGTVSASCALSVLHRDPEITVQTKEIALSPGESAQIGAALLYEDGTLLYAVENEAVANVGQDGTVTAVGAGETTVKVSFEGAETQSVRVIVTIPEPDPEPEPEPDPQPDPE